MAVRTKSRTTPKHHANLYYTGNAGRLGVDLNIDYMWQKNTGRLNNRESSSYFEDALVNSATTNRSRLLAEKIVLSYPLWKGELEFGEEYTTSRFASDYVTDSSILDGACSRVDENNRAGFAQIAQRFGNWNVSAGVRYEHVSFSYLENGQRRDEMGRTYNNLFPTVSASGMIRNLQLALSYTHKTQRPSYGDLDGTIDYINRFTFEGGNPYLKPEKIHDIQLMAAWSKFFGQLSYSYKKDPILHTTTPYGEDGEVKLITKTNFPKIQQLEAFAGAQFQVGIWQPKVNLGIIKQWLSIDHDGARKRLESPIGLIQFQNAIHLPADIWLNIDLQWMSAGDGENARITSTSYLNAKLYKAFLNNSLSVTLEANDIFNRNIRDFTFYNKDVTLTKYTHITNRTFQITMQYTFNTSRDRYAGKGAGHNELDRF
ncbi:MAG: outer membrane beta-barrel family protein [Duncaniella sp.]|nr:outer membrane beta-barrel family protein [Duncaniella sp.]